MGREGHHPDAARKRRTAHDFDPDRAIAATFQTLPGASFVVNGAAQARDAALTAASAEMTWRNGFAVGATFEDEFSNVTRSHAGKDTVRYAWQRVLDAWQRGLELHRRPVHEYSVGRHKFRWSVD